MYTAWKATPANGAGASLLIPASVRRWNLPPELIRRSSTHETTKLESEKPQRQPIWPEAELAQARLAEGFEHLLQLMLFTGESRRTVLALSRDDLMTSVEIWSNRLTLPKIRRRQLRRLANEFWTLLDSLTLEQTTKSTSAADSRWPSITPAALAAGLRQRIHSRLDFLTLRRSLLRFAADAFALISEAGVDTEWTPRLLQALTAETANVGQLEALRAALAEANNSVDRNGRGGGGVDRGREFSRLNRETWLRMVHAQFF